MASRRTGRSSFVATLLLSCICMGSALNITSILEEFPDLSILNEMLIASGVAEEINSRTSVTLLAPNNDALTAFKTANPDIEGEKMRDLLRYHVLLQYITIPLITDVDYGRSTAVATLFQTTGRAVNDEGGYVNIYNTRPDILVGQATRENSPNSTIVNTVYQEPFSISILMIDHTLLPVGFETPIGGANITGVLEGLGEYNLFVSFLRQTGVDSIFAGRQTGEGITIFAPTDDAFNALPAQWFESFSAQQQKLLMEYHALTSYNALGLIWTFQDNMVPTISSTSEGLDTYNVVITSDAGSVIIYSSAGGQTPANLTSTLFDATPVIMYSIDAVLLPRELFGSKPSAPFPSPTEAPAPTPGPAPSPKKAKKSKEKLTTNALPAAAPSPLPVSSASFVPIGKALQLLMLPMMLTLGTVL